MIRRDVSALLVAAGILLPVAVSHAQDSVAPPGGAGLRSDALDAYRASPPSLQVRDYVVDLAPIESSWGARFAVGPVAKSSRSSLDTSANHLIATQAMAPTLIGSPMARNSYSFWLSAGAGANPLINSPPDSLGTAGFVGQRTALTFAEFGAGPDTVFGTGDDEQDIIAAAIDFQFRRPNRLFVSRVVALQNKPSPAPGDTATASLGLGAIDNAGNIAVLADGFGILSPSRLTGRDYLRVAALERDPTRVNRLQQSGADDPAATVRILDSQTLLTPPALIPQAIAARPVLFGAAFNADLLYESSPGSTSTTHDYLPAPDASPRGSVVFVPGVFAPLSDGSADAGCALALVREPGAPTRSISVFGVNTGGSVDHAQLVRLPDADGSLVDPVDPYDPSTYFPGISSYAFTNVQSQAAFRGGSQVAGAVLPDGDFLLAAAIAFPSAGSSGSSVPQEEHGAIVVARISHSTGHAAWTIAAHTGDADGAHSKPIYGDYGADGVQGTGDPGEGDGVIDSTPVGNLTLHSHAEPGASSGPSFSSPAMDSDGNLYFLAYVRLNTPGGHAFSQALLRANYNPAASPAGGYSLEVLARVGQVVNGENSARAYRIAYLGVADGDSIDSGATWAGNVTRGRIAGAPAGPLPVGSPLSLGMLAVRAKIVYDVDADGAFVDPETADGATADQSYNVVLAIMPRIDPADFNRDSAVNSQDFFDFLGALFNGSADYNGDAAVNSQDLFDFLGDFFGA